MVDYLKDSKILYAQHLEPIFGAPCGNSETEVAAFERKIGYVLPLAYKQYLYWTGTESKGVWNRDCAGLEWACFESFPDDANDGCMNAILEDSSVTFRPNSQYLVFFTY